jgi:PAS domain S-box-containing protein
VANLAAIVLKEKFDRIIDVGTSLATRVQFRKLIEAGDWDGAIKILERAPTDFSYLDSVALFDPKGTVMAVTPLTPSIREAIGKNFAYRDYYKGVSKDWQPYVSEVFKRAVEPKYNVVSIAVPIKSESVIGQEPTILGILLLTIKLDTILEWSREIDVGEKGFVYFVDRNGNVAGHPKFSTQKDIINFSDIPFIQRALKGEHGIEYSYNKIGKQKEIVAFAQVPVYGWAAINQQPDPPAFVLRDSALRKIFIVNVISIAILIIFLYLILRFIQTLNLFRQKERIYLESVGDGLIAIDRSWNIVLWNKAASILTGFPKEEVMGKPFRDIVKFIRESDRKENIVFIEETMLFGKTRLMEDHTVLVTKSGNEIPVGDSAAPIFDSSGRVVGAIIIFRDISKEREVGLLRSNFAYASHQLRTPVTKALWQLETVLEKNELHQIKEGVQIAFDFVKSIRRLSEQIINVSELDQGTVISKRSLLKLSDLINETVKVLENKAKLRQVGISKEPILPDLTINSDYQLLKMALIKILENAIDYNILHGKVKVRALKQEKGVVIEIEDGGIGIPDSEKPLVFNKFFRGSNFNTTDIVGAGLGLYIAKEYIKLLGGKIWFESKENKGTTFYIAIPLEEKNKI